MPRKTEIRIVGRQPQHDFDAHAEANRRAEDWAKKCITYRKAGKRLEAERAEQKMRHWLRKAVAFESTTDAESQAGKRH